MRIDSPISCNAQITGSFTGSFIGDGSGITGVTAEWDGSHNGDATITGSLTVSSDIIVDGTVDGVDVSDLNTSYLATSASAASNAAAIAALDDTYATDTDLTSLSSSAHTQRLAIETGLDSDISNLSGSAHTQRVALDSAQSTALTSVSGAFASTISSLSNEDTLLDARVTALEDTDIVITLTGDVTGTGTITDLGDVSFETTIADDSHNHTIANIDGLQDALNLKAPLASPALTGNPTAPTQAGSDDSTKIATTAFVQDRIDTVIGTAGSTLDTLGELSASLSNDQDALTALTTTVGTKLAKASNLSDLQDAATARVNLGVDPAGTDNSTLAGLTATAIGKAVITGSDAAAIRISLGVDAAGTNNYSHPSHPGDDINIDTGVLSGAKVISDLDFNVTTDTLGHVTDANATIATRDLTLADLGYSGDANANNYSLPLGTSTTRGGFKIGYSENGKNYPVEISSEKMYVNVPWTDTNTTYTRADFIDQDVNTNSSVSFDKVTVDASSTKGLYFTSDPGGGTGDLARIRYYATSGEITKLHLSVANDADDTIHLDASGGTDVSNTLRVTGDVIAYYSSDERLKDNIIPIEGALEKVEKLGGYEFDWNDKQKDYEGHDIGVIAQEVEAIFPELVATRDNGFKAVKYEKLTAVLLQAVKELSEKVKQLENK
jgi:hypothetical protein